MPVLIQTTEVKAGGTSSQCYHLCALLHVFHAEIEFCCFNKELNKAGCCNINALHNDTWFDVCFCKLVMDNSKHISRYRL